MSQNSITLNLHADLLPNMFDRLEDRLRLFASTLRNGDSSGLCVGESVRGWPMKNKYNYYFCLGLLGGTYIFWLAGGWIELHTVNFNKFIATPFVKLHMNSEIIPATFRRDHSIAMQWERTGIPPHREITSMRTP